MQYFQYGQLCQPENIFFSLKSPATGLHCEV